MTQFKDYYAVMGVAPTATSQEIKRAYRKLARKYHPDVSKEAKAEEHFKEVNEANAVLSDPEKRAAYDKLRQGGWQSEQEFTPPPGWERQTHFRQGSSSMDGGGAGTQDFSDFFESLFGGGGGGFGATGRQRQQTHFRARGEDVHYKLGISLKDAYRGLTQSIQLQMPEIDAQGNAVSKMRTLNVKIPAGVTQGQQIRLRGQGAPGMGGGPHGDLYLEIELKPDPIFTVEGKNVLLTLPITPWEAALGATIPVPTLAGKVDLKIPANSQTGQKLRLKQRGLPGNPPGDQYVILKAMIAPAITEAAKNLYKEMANTIAFNPRENLGV
jgi:curved DNA-binding protein